MTSPSLIEIERLSIRRGSFELRIPEWKLAPGEVVGVVGPNGAGKSTLLESIAGLRRSPRGSVRVFGEDPYWRPEVVRRTLGFMADDMPIFAMRIGSLLKHLSGYYPTWDEHLAAELLERFELSSQEKSWKLSKGQATRLRIVLALSFRPRVLVLDEPASGLDLGGRRALLETVMEVVQDPSQSVLVSSHMLADVERIADRLLVLNKGSIVQEGPTNSLVGDERTLEEALVSWGAA